MRSDNTPTNMTPLRIRALEIVRDTPGVCLGVLAERLEYRGRYSDGQLVRGTAQGATRWGGAYAAPLVRAGLLRKDTRVSAGGADLYITDKGLQALEDALLASGLQGN